MSQSDEGSGGPPAIIHKRILDIAEANPEASLEVIADTVTGASIDLVDRVLREYGDPGEDSNSVSGAGNSLNSSNDYENGADEHMSQGETTDEPADDRNEGEPSDHDGDTGDETTQAPDRSELSDKQVDALRRIRENPDATQRELAEELDVTAATVSRWLNDISGFAWEHRRSIASRTLNGTNATDGAHSRDATGGEDREATNHQRDRQGSISDLERRVEILERETEEHCEAPAVRFEVDLLHKVIHACIASERITEEEELRILNGLIGGTDETGNHDDRS